MQKKIEVPSSGSRQRFPGEFTCSNCRVTTVFEESIASLPGRLFIRELRRLKKDELLWVIGRLLERENQIAELIASDCINCVDAPRCEGGCVNAKVLEIAIGTEDKPQINRIKRWQHGIYSEGQPDE